MELGYIDSENLEIFQSLILPSVVEDIKKGEPVIAWGITENQTAIAALTAVISQYTLVVTSYYVSSEYRHIGAGKLLLQEVEKVARKNILGIRIQFAAITDEHKELADFLERHSYYNDADLQSAAYEISLEKLFSYPVFSKKVEHKIDSFEDVHDSVLKKATKIALVEDRPIPQGGFIADSVDKEVSMIYMKDKDVVAYLAFEKIMQNTVILSAAWNGSKDVSIFFKMLQQSAQKLKEKYSNNTTLLIRVTNNESYKLMKYLLPDMSCISYDMRKDG